MEGVTMCDSASWKGSPSGLVRWPGSEPGSAGICFPPPSWLTGDPYLWAAGISAPETPGATVGLQGGPAVGRPFTAAGRRGGHSLPSVQPLDRVHRHVRHSHPGLGSRWLKSGRYGMCTIGLIPWRAGGARRVHWPVPRR